MACNGIITTKDHNFRRNVELPATPSGFAGLAGGAGQWPLSGCCAARQRASEALRGALAADLGRRGHDRRGEVPKMAGEASTEWGKYSYYGER